MAPRPTLHAPRDGQRGGLRVPASSSEDYCIFCFLCSFLALTMIDRAVGPAEQMLRCTTVGFWKGKKATSRAHASASSLTKAGPTLATTHSCCCGRWEGGRVQSMCACVIQNNDTFFVVGGGQMVGRSPGPPSTYAAVGSAMCAAGETLPLLGY